MGAECILPKKALAVNYGFLRDREKISRIYSFLFRKTEHILLRSVKERRMPMRESSDPHADLEDLIFDEDAGYPSSR